MRESGICCEPSNLRNLSILCDFRSAWQEKIECLSKTLVRHVRVTWHRHDFSLKAGSCAFGPTARTTEAFIYFCFLNPYLIPRNNNGGSGFQESDMTFQMAARPDVCACGLQSKYLPGSACSEWQICCSGFGRSRLCGGHEGPPGWVLILGIESPENRKIKYPPLS